MPKDLESVVEARGSTPKCFLNLHIPRILRGEKLMRSVDAVRNSDLLQLRRRAGLMTHATMATGCLLL